ncbi:retron-type reverse transcriptase [Clostridium sp. CAG:813]|nr:retron-type reverse transcriptase [Clostridium sp. CAG:813]
MKNIKDFAKELSLDVKTIEKLTRDNFNYYHFTIPKGNGEKRLITAPKGKLKVIQKWILVNCLEKFAVAECATAFIKGKHGIRVNAESHQYNKYILEFDLKDFFPNISFWDVQNLFLRMNLSQKLSILFAKLCTYDGYLPQGAITSPYISNLICYDLDLKLLELCDYYDITYTRYADDLTFSSDELYLLLSLMQEISSIIHYYGFKVNYNKTKVLLPSNKQTITGITVNNGEIKVDKKLKRMVRAKLYYGIKNNDIKDFDILLGFISYICSIEIDYKSKMISYVQYLLNKFGRHDNWGLLKILNK